MTGNDFNPRPLAGATFVVVNGVGSVVISIHAPLRGRLNGYDRLLYRITISIHAPLRGRLSRSLVRFSSCAFQSTPPCGGDPGDVKTFLDCPYFNPRPLAGATNFVGVAHHGLGISIHAPLRGRPRVPPFSTLKCGFQSTPPCGGDNNHVRRRLSHNISIHAPLRGRHQAALAAKALDIFQSTPPCGGDFWRGLSRVLCNLFQSTPPCGGDHNGRCGSAMGKISIHAPLRGRRHFATRHCW